MFTAVLFLHLLGAAVWTGGHLVLALAILPGVLRRRDLAPLQQFESRFERVGIPALLVQVATGLWLAYRWLPEPSRWFSFSGRIEVHVGAKLVLLLATLVLAVHARFFIIPKLHAGNLLLLALHILGVTLLAVGFVLVGVLIRTGGA